MTDNTRNSIGFIGLGVMGEPMCRNIAVKSGFTVYGLDPLEEPLARLASAGVRPAASLEELCEACNIILLSLPSGDHVTSVCEGPQGLLELTRPGQLVVDMGTSPVELTRRLAAAFAERGVTYCDAPVARTRQAAENGTLSIMVGADAATFERLLPILSCCGTDITHCGDVGSGQLVKILNNMVMIETVVAISEALAIAKRSGMDGSVLFKVLSMGSGDSFALRNHGMKSVLPQEFPERSFSARYARKDLGYALDLATQVGVAADGARNADRLLDRAVSEGYGDLYWPVIARVLDTGPVPGADSGDAT